MTRDKQPKIKLPPPAPTFIETLIAGIGSIWSIAAHTVIFATCFIAATIGLIEWELMLLVLTTVVSLEAIYLALFIQITVNRNTASLKDVEEDIEELGEDLEELSEDVEDIQEDIEEIQEDVEEISEDIDEIQEDVEELNEEEEDEQAPVATPAPTTVPEKKGKKPTKNEMLEKLTVDVARLLEDLEQLKKSK